MRLIDADKALEKISKMIDYCEKDTSVNGLTALFQVGDAIMDCKTVDARLVKHGKWTPCFEDWRRQIEGDKCSICGFEHYGTNIRNYNYCPNCGALMQEE